jgi:hypothetical protein
MSIGALIQAYITGQPAAKRDDLQALDRLIRRVSPECRLWFLDGTNEDGRTVANPNIGYGSQTITYAGGRARDFYRIGLSANTGGISIYIIGLEDKMYLARALGTKLGKASVTGYCIKFRALRDIDLDVLADVIRFGFTRPDTATPST